MVDSRRATTFALLILCAVLSLAGTDMILPALPQLPRIFSTNEATAQQVLAAYAGGTALGLLLFGRLADHFWRKTLLLASLVVFAAASIACVFARNIGALILLRFVQGSASAAAPVFGPGIIRQLFNEKSGVRAIGVLGSVESLSPALAPILGAAMLAWFGWQSSFELLGGVALVAALSIVVLDLPREDHADSARGSYLQLLTDPVYMRYALTQAMTLGGLLTFVFAAPVVIVETMGGTLNDFLVMQIVSVGGFIVTANLTSKISERFGTERVILFGTAVAAIDALTLLGYGLSGVANSHILPALFLPMAIGLGLRGPPGFYRGVVASGSNNARGSALIVFFILMMTTLGTVIAAPFITQGLVPLTLVVSGIHAVSLALFIFLPQGHP